ncbi:NfeD family protein [Fodinicola feengrottensis]|uniref:NfeD family protein n=1 Tax=Fodinicola feengrottensis TaxID=435914 RepID=A0ABN2IWG0_9ACTN|nr:NfeD family protein [Fodinicola feengrottensis]
MAWLIWLVLAAGLAVVEIFSLDFVFIMLAAGALAAAGGAALGAGLPIQLALFVAVAGLALVLVRPIAKRQISQGPTLRHGAAALVGETAKVLQRVGPESGLVKVAGQEWTARPFDATQQIEIGETVHVLKIQGATALVWKEP